MRIPRWVRGGVFGAACALVGIPWTSWRFYVLLGTFTILLHLDVVTPTRYTQPH